MTGEEQEPNSGGSQATGVAGDGDRWFIDSDYGLKSQLKPHQDFDFKRRRDYSINDEQIIKQKRLDADCDDHQAPRKHLQHNHQDDHLTDHQNKPRVTNEEDEQDEEGLFSEALLAVASAEEYAAKIIKLQQACLTPLKEDLADWLNKILNTSNITTENFMDKLDNGVIICRLAKIISLWCEQQLKTKNVQETNSEIVDIELNHGIKPLPRLGIFVPGNSQLRSVSQSTSCLSTSPLNVNLSNVNNGYTSLSTNQQFLNNLIKMDQTKIWEDAKCRTFYARDNVCNFIKWSRGFGVNQSVLFESDDLVLHANARQVVLCLLDVARIAYVKYNFTEAPGLVKFEQEIDRELAVERANATLTSKNFSQNLLLQPKISDNNQQSVDGNGENANVNAHQQASNEHIFSSRYRDARGSSIGDATDDLILRYCKHKEEEAARKKKEELLELEKATAEQTNESTQSSADRLIDLNLKEIDNTTSFALDSLAIDSNEKNDCLADRAEDQVIKSPTFDESMSHNQRQHNSMNECPVDSLDSGRGNTEESASTSQSNTPNSSARKSMPSIIPTLTKGAYFSSPKQNGQTNSGLSSSRSSLFSGHDDGSDCTPKPQISSDLDGKVMRIAKSYYGKGVTKGVTRLSEGKYRIADRIVFVRLLKGHRVMVRIGGGWDTLENFLFRHKSDPSQVIDVDNLLPLETKMSFEKGPLLTPTHTKLSSKLPFYRRSSSASSTNLSISNRTASNHSLTSCIVPSIRDSSNNNLSSHQLTHQNRQSSRQNIPCLLLNQANSNSHSHSNNNNSSITSNSSAYFDHNNYQPPHKNYLKRTPASNKMQYNNNGKYNNNNRPIGNLKTPTASATNLYPATLTTRITPASANNSNNNIKTIGSAKLNSTTNLHNEKSFRQEITKKLGRSNDSLQANNYKSPYRFHPQNGNQTSLIYHGNLSSNKKKPMK